MRCSGIGTIDFWGPTNRCSLLYTGKGIGEKGLPFMRKEPFFTRKGRGTDIFKEALSFFAKRNCYGYLRLFTSDKEPFFLAKNKMEYQQKKQKNGISKKQTDFLVIITALPTLHFTPGSSKRHCRAQPTRVIRTAPQPSTGKLLLERVFIW